MARKTLLTPATAADTTGVTWDSSIARKHGNENFVLAADTLAGAETVTIEIFAGKNTWITYDVSGTPVTLTATQPHVTLPSGPLYRFKKGATAATCGIQVSY